MQYSLGESLANTGFTFYEKIHEPIFLVHKVRGISGINEAGRKLLSVTHTSLNDLNALTANYMQKLFQSNSRGYSRLRVQNSPLQLVARTLKGSDFVLVEVKSTKGA